MPQIIIYLEEKLDEKAKQYANNNKISKVDGILRLIKIGLKNESK